MKSFVFTLAIVLLLTTIWFFTTDLNSYNRYLQQLKHIAEEASVAGTLYTQREALANGVIIFEDEQALAAVTGVIRENMNLGYSMQPEEDAYWQDTVQVTVCLIDESGSRTYQDGSLTDRVPVSFPYLLEIPGEDFVRTIARPAVCVFIDAGEVTIGGGVLAVRGALQMSGAHEWVAR